MKRAPARMCRGSESGVQERQDLIPRSARARMQPHQNVPDKVLALYCGRKVFLVDLLSCLAHETQKEPETIETFAPRVLETTTKTLFPAVVSTDDAAPATDHVVRELLRNPRK